MTFVTSFKITTRIYMKNIVKYMSYTCHIYIYVLSFKREQLPSTAAHVYRIWLAFWRYFIGFEPVVVIDDGPLPHIISSCRFHALDLFEIITISFYKI